MRLKATCCWGEIFSPQQLWTRIDLRCFNTKMKTFSELTQVREPLQSAESNLKSPEAFNRRLLSDWRYMLINKTGHKTANHIHLDALFASRYYYLPLLLGLHHLLCRQSDRMGSLRSGSDRTTLPIVGCAKERNPLWVLPCPSWSPV